ncbi:tetratricopeptide repeat protein [Actinosynnema sp. CA-299493]
MTSLSRVLINVRFHMMQGEVEEAVRSLVDEWPGALAEGCADDVVRLHETTLELADRFPLAEAVSHVLHRATVAYARAGDFTAATVTAARMVSVWRARCQRNPTPDNLAGHIHALDTMAGIFRARDMAASVVGCLVELAEWHLTHGNNIGVAWALREIGALALRSDNLTNAAEKFTRADEIYADEAGDPSAAEERAECHVLLGRLAYINGDHETARLWLERAAVHLKDDAEGEVRSLIEELSKGDPLPELRILKVGVFGLPFWENDEQSDSIPCSEVST